MTELSPGSLRSLQDRMSERLDTMFQGALSSGVRRAIAEVCGEEAGRWLKDRASGEVFDSQGEYALRRAADEAWVG